MQTVEELLKEKIQNSHTRVPSELVTSVVEYYKRNNIPAETIGNLCVYNRAGLSDEITIIVHSQPTCDSGCTSFTLNLLNNKIEIDSHR